MHKLVYLIGAGVSFPMGIPTMREFANAFEKELEKNSLEKFVVQGIKEYFGDEEWDIENLLLLLRSSLSIGRNKAFNLLELKYSYGCDSLYINLFTC